MEDFVPLNFRLLGQPLNWVIILLMLIIAGFAIDMVYKFVVTHNISNNSES
jgi:hypothetical protein